MASYDEAIPPGKVGKVTAQLKTEHYRGPVEKTITVTSSDPQNPSLTLHLKANVVGSVEILPAAFMQFPTPVTWAFSGRLVVRKEGSETGELKITDLTTTAPWLIAKAHKLEQPEPPKDGEIPTQAGDWIVDVSVSDAAPVGPSGQQVTFKTGLGREPQVVVSVSVVLQEALEVVPKSVLLRVGPGAHEAQGIFSVMVRPGLVGETVKATVSPDAFGVTLAREDEHRYTGTVRWMGKGENPERSANVVLSVGGETVSVPVRVVDRRVPPARPPQAQATPGQTPAQAVHP